MGESYRIVLRTYAKLNLCLDVLGKRQDGYHEINSLFQNISLFDEMDITLSDGKGKLLINSNVNIGNNVLNSVWELVNCDNKNVYVNLQKNIPMGGGLGGGSSNAAGFIIALEKVGIISKEQSLKIAQKVGSDVPFFLFGGTAIVKGRGEVILPVEPLTNFGKFKVDLHLPNFSISTKEAYSKLKAEWFGKAPITPEELYNFYKMRNFEMIKKGTYNIFERVIPMDLLEKIESLRRDFPAALTGSGSTYFALKEDGKYSFVPKGVEINAFEKS